VIFPGGRHGLSRGRRAHRRGPAAMGVAPRVREGHGPRGAPADVAQRQGFLTPVRPTLNFAPLKPSASSEAQNFDGFSLYSALNTALCPT